MRLVTHGELERNVGQDAKTQVNRHSIRRFIRREEGRAAQSQRGQAGGLMRCGVDGHEALAEETRVRAIRSLESK